MDTLGKTGAWMLAVQVLSGGVAYWMMISYGAGDIAFKSALVAVWAVLVLSVFWAVYVDDRLSLALSLSSLAAILAALCAELSGPPAFTGALVLMCFALTFLATRLAPAGDEGFFLRFLGALPVLGGLMYLSGLLSGDYRSGEKKG